MQDYYGIRYPDRAENLEESIFANYEVYLDPWTPIVKKIAQLYEGMAVRNATEAVVIFGDQGSGKTLFARKIVHDFGLQEEGYNSKNIWHRVTGGLYHSIKIVENTQVNTDILHIEDDDKWRSTLANWASSRAHRHRIVIADNAERTYFIQGLLEVGNPEYIDMQRDPGSLYKRAAERFVQLCRTTLRGSLFIILTNNADFALNLVEETNNQHIDLLTIEVLPQPGNVEKEMIVRTNINKLNPISYWFCLDRAGREAKVEVHNAIKSNQTYPSTFRAVNNAISSAERTRMGRPAGQNLLDFIVFANSSDARGESISLFGEGEERLSNRHIKIVQFRDGWASQILGDANKSSLLACEWNLRLVICGNSIVDLLLNNTKHAQIIFDQLKTAHTPGTQIATREEYWKSFGDSLEALPLSESPDLTAFWSLGARRSVEYESKLKQIYPDFDKATGGFLTYRPDLTIKDYEPCTVLNAVNATSDAINASIKRQAHVFEFTAVNALSDQALKTYLEVKLPNYVAVMQNQ
jgi:hypothetical protein